MENYNPSILHPAAIKGKIQLKVSICTSIKKVKIVDFGESSSCLYKRLRPIPLITTAYVSWEDVNVTPYLQAPPFS